MRLFSGNLRLRSLYIRVIRSFLPQARLSADDPFRGKETNQANNGGREIQVFLFRDETEIDPDRGCPKLPTFDLTILLKPREILFMYDVEFKELITSFLLSIYLKICKHIILLFINFYLQFNCLRFYLYFHFFRLIAKNLYLLINRF